MASKMAEQRSPVTPKYAAWQIGGKLAELFEGSVTDNILILGSSWAGSVLPSLVTMLNNFQSAEVTPHAHWHSTRVSAIPNCHLFVVTGYCPAGTTGSFNIVIIGS